MSSVLSSSSSSRSLIRPYLPYIAQHSQPDPVVPASGARRTSCPPRADGRAAGGPRLAGAAAGRSARRSPSRDPAPRVSTAVRPARAPVHAVGRRLDAEHEPAAVVPDRTAAALLRVARRASALAAHSLERPPAPPRADPPRARAPGPLAGRPGAVRGCGTALAPTHGGTGGRRP